MNETMRYIFYGTAVVLFLPLFALIFLDQNTLNTNRRVKIKMISNPEGMREELLRHIPTGTSIYKAQNIMENNGFECELSTGSFYQGQSGDPKRINHDNIDFLYCKKFTGWFFRQGWQIAIVHTNAEVTDIIVSWYRYHF